MTVRKRQWYYRKIGRGEGQFDRCLDSGNENTGIFEGGFVERCRGDKRSTSGTSLISLRPTFSFRFGIEWNRTHFRVSLSRGILIGFARLAVRPFPRRKGTSFLPLERIPFGVRRFPDSRKTHDAASSKGGDRPASPARASKNKRSRDATQERNRCCVRRGGEARSLPRMRNLFTVDEARWEI